MLEEGNTSSTWQSSGSNPHAVTITFTDEYTVGTLAIQYGTPGLWSYEPKRVVVHAGSDLNGLVGCLMINACP